MKNEYVKPEMIITSYEADNVIMSGIATTGGNLTSPTSMTYESFF